MRQSEIFRAQYVLWWGVWHVLLASGAECSENIIYWPQKGKTAFWMKIIILNLNDFWEMKIPSVTYTVKNWKRDIFRNSCKYFAVLPQQDISCSTLPYCTGSYVYNRVVTPTILFITNHYKKLFISHDFHLFRSSLACIVTREGMCFSTYFMSEIMEPDAKTIAIDCSIRALLFTEKGERV